MAGFMIHLAIGKRYIEKHKLEIENEEEFYRGIIAPDLYEGNYKNKSESHYGMWGDYQAITNIDEFLKDSKVDMSKDYWKGYFVHLLSDYYFYQKDFCNEYSEIIKNRDKFYSDYDCLNKELIEMYDIPKLDNINNYINYIERQPRYLKRDKVVEYIEKVSDFNIKDEVKIIKEKGMEGLK